MDVKHFSDILNAVSYAVVAMDTKGRLLYLNGPAREFFKAQGREMNSYPGNPAERVLPLATPLAMGAMEREDFRSGRGRVVEMGRELFFEITPLMDKDVLLGAVVSLQRPERFELLANRLRGYQRLSKQLQAVFNSSSDGIWVTDGRGVVIDINKASMRLNGIAAETLVGKSMEHIVEQGLVDQSVTLAVLKNRRQVSLIQHLKKTGRQILATGTPVLDDDGEISLVVVNERDLTELNDLRRDLAIAKQSREKVQKELDGLLMRELEGKGMVAESPAMRKVLATALKLAQLDVGNLLLTGESGVGKGMLAKFIHRNSPRKDRPFLGINCAALPESLFEAELFGHEEGAFTGAREGGRLGLLELTGQGTLFLDEIGELPLHIQPKLLKCLDEKEFLPLGGSKPRTIECRIVTATNQDLEELVRTKRFREDLFYRLSAFNVVIPPLRERLEDIFELAGYFLEMFNERYSARRYLGARSMKVLQAYDFPGNVRELRGLIRKGVVMAEDDDLYAYLEECLLPGAAASVREPESLAQAVEAAEREMLSRARAACSGTRDMARFLGVSQPTVVRKLRKHGLGGNRDN